MTTSTKGIAAQRSPRLPEIDRQNIPAWKAAQGSVSITLSLIAALMVAAMLVSWLVTVTETVDGVGVLEPSGILGIRAREAGIVSDVLVEQGDVVEHGQVVARLDPAATQLIIAELESQLAGLREDIGSLIAAAPISLRRVSATLAQAEADVIRARTALRSRMTDFGVSTSADPDSVARALDTRIHIGLDLPSADLLAAQANRSVAIADSLSMELGKRELKRKQFEVKRIETRLDDAKRRLDRNDVRSLARGVVLTERVNRLLGSTVAAGELLFEVGDTTRWQVDVAVNERDVHKISVGDSAQVEMPALANLALDLVRGRVGSVSLQAAGIGSPSAALSSASVAGGYHVRIELDPRDVTRLPSGVLRRGLTARGKVITKRERVAVLAWERLRASLRGAVR